MQQWTRREDRRLLTGHGRFVADMPVLGCLDAVFVRRRIAHGVVREVDCTAAREVPGVVGGGSVGAARVRARRQRARPTGNFRTPRTTIKAFCDLLAVLEQNPGANWQEILGTVDLAPEANPDLVPFDDEAGAGDDDLASFRL